MDPPGSSFGGDDLPTLHIGNALYAGALRRASPKARFSRPLDLIRSFRRRAIRVANSTDRGNANQDLLHEQSGGSELRLLARGDAARAARSRFCNRRIELELAVLGGRKSLYSDVCYPEDEFWSLHDHATYLALKRRYDPESALGDLYAKCVLRR